MTLDQAVDALVGVLEEGGCGAAESAIGDVLKATRDPLDGNALERAVDALRAHTCFPLMALVCERALPLAEGKLALRIGGQWGQALIELKDVEKARDVLRGQVGAARAAGGAEKSELLGRLGRLAKDLHIAGSEDALDEALSYYAEAYPLDPSWHGANLVALVARAERAGRAVATKPSVEWADKLLRRFKKIPSMQQLPWDFAAAGEAYLAKEDWDGAAKCFCRYWHSPGVTLFALKSTERQLRDVWQVGSGNEDDFPRSLLTHIQARGMASAGSSTILDANELVALAHRLECAEGNAEAVFGAATTVPLTTVRNLLRSAQGICRVKERGREEGGGTGFLVAGKSLHEDLPDELVVLTNHHVLHESDSPGELLNQTAYDGAIPVNLAEAEFHYLKGVESRQTIRLKDVVASSPRHELDFSVATLREQPDGGEPLELCGERAPLRSPCNTQPKLRSRVFVVGHPGGRRLRFSFSDNEVVDHDLTGAPPSKPPARRIHYRTPTKGGSSGSPVFHDAHQEVIGLHRSGEAPPLRDPWPGKAAGEDPYEANEAVAICSIREYVTQAGIARRDG